MGGGKIFPVSGFILGGGIGSRGSCGMIGFEGGGAGALLPLAGASAGAIAYAPGTMSGSTLD